MPSAGAMLHGFNAPGGAAHVFAAAIAEMARAEAAALFPVIC